MLNKFSSRQCVIISFTVIILMLCGVVLQSWLRLEALAQKSMRVGHQVVEIFTSLQGLDERGIDLERSVQQYRVVQQANFRANFDLALEQAFGLISRLEQQKESIQGLGTLLNDWRSTARNLADNLDKETDSAFIGSALSRLSELQSRMRKLGQQWIDSQDGQIVSELETQRTLLRFQLLAAALGAALIVFFVSQWLTRPVRQIKNAISRFECGVFNEGIKIEGLADYQNLGECLERVRLRLQDTEKTQENTLRHVEERFRTPLSVLKNNIELLAEETSGPLTQNQREVIAILRENLDQLQQQTDGMKSLIERLFDMRDISRQHVKLRELMTLVVESQNEHPRFPKVKVNVDFVCSLDTTVWVDVEKVICVMGHIFGNALDFAPEGSKVKLSVNLANGKLLLECLDEGPGVPPQEAPHIFEIFYNGQSRPDYCPPVNNGLSLSIAKELARIMGGDIQLLDTSPGAHFKVSLSHEFSVTEPKQ